MWPATHTSRQLAHGGDPQLMGALRCSRAWSRVQPGLALQARPPPARPACSQRRRLALWSEHLLLRTSGQAASTSAAQPVPSNTAQAAGAQQQQASSSTAAPKAAAAGSGSTALRLEDVWQLLRPDWPMLAACAACAMVSVVCNVFVAPTMGKVIDVISRGTAATPRELAVAVARLGSVYVGSNVTLAAQVALSLSIAESLAARLRSELFLRLLGRDALFFDRVRTGQMTSWLGQDVEVLQSTVAKLLGARGIRSAFETVGIIAVLFTLSPLLAATLLVSAPLLTPLIVRLSQQIGGASKKAQAAADEVSATADELIENIKVVKLFGAEGRELSRFERLVDRAHQLATQVTGLQGLLDISSRLRNTVCVLSTLGLGAWLALTGKVTVGTCYSFFIFSFSFAFSLGNLATTAGDLAKAGGAVARALAAMRQAGGEEEAGQQGSGTGTLPAAETATSSGGEAGAGSSCSSGSSRIPDEQFRGEIEFRGVSFRHPGWEGWTLSDINFSVPAGSTVALVGPSGGGKSTLASLVMGLYEPQEGSVLVDGVPLSRLDMQWWRRQLGVVMQDAGLMTGRVRDIIAYGRPDASDADVEAAARAAEAHAFIQGLPQAYQTEIGPKGVELSGGQRQRLAIARALLVRPRVLLLDEATSALDVETEASVAQALDKAGRETTTLVIAHRLSTVRRADRIVVVAAGRVVESGTHEELLGLQGGVYQRLVAKAQRRGRDSWETDLSSSSEGESDVEGEAAAAAAVPALSGSP